VAADANGSITVTDRGQSVAIRSFGGPATRANLGLVVLDGRNGNDKLTTDASLNTLVNGTLSFSPDAIFLGGNGNDTLTAGHGGIVGGAAGVVNGVVVGPVVGNCFMDGGNGNDTLFSGFGNDVMKGGNGDDTYVWLPGTLTDVWDGGAGNDTAIIVGNDTTAAGTPAADAFSLTANGSRVLFQRTNLVQFAVDIGSTEKVVLRPGAGDDMVKIGDLSGVANLREVVAEGGDGNDTLDGSGQFNANIKLTLLGGAGNDTLIGGAGRDRLEGGDGNDVLNSGADNWPDELTGGAGADRFLKGRGDRVTDFSPEDMFS
jgi:Ca2+-binding RTX toxin-like protein